MSDEKLEKLARTLAAEVFYQRANEVLRGVLQEFMGGKEMRGQMFFPITGEQVQKCRARLEEAYNMGVGDSWGEADSIAVDLAGKSRVAVERVQDSIKALKIADPPKP